MVDGEHARDAFADAPASARQDAAGEDSGGLRPAEEFRNGGGRSLDVVLSRHDVVHPDILFVSRKRRDSPGEKYVDGAPDLVVEVLSPSTEARDRVVKAKRYANVGVREMWLVDPEANTIEVLVNSEEGFRHEAIFGESEIVRSVVLAGLDRRSPRVSAPLSRLVMRGIPRGRAGARRFPPPIPARTP